MGDALSEATGMADLKFDKDSLDKVTKGLRAAISELKDVGDDTGALQGSGFEDLALSKADAGGNNVADAFEDFCDRWEWGVRALVQDANGLAQRLGLAAGMMYEEDKYWEGTFKIGLNSLAGNPHATEDEVVKQSYGDIATPDAPDYSAASFKQAGGEMAQTWKDTGRSLVTEGRGGAQADLFRTIAGVDEEEFDRGVDQTFGPSPEERARQASAGQGEG